MTREPGTSGVPGAGRPPVVAEDGAVTVVGGGVSAISTAAALRRLGHRGRLTVVDDGPVPHDRPPLSKAYLLGELDDDGVRLQPPSWFVDNGVDLRPGRRAVALDAGSATVTLDGGELLHADAVVLAEGATARPLPVPGGALVTTLRTLTDARLLRPRLVPGAHLVVVGAGLVGAEVTATALALGVSVTLVDPDPLPLVAAFGREVAAELHAEHARHGATVLPHGVVAVEVVDGEQLAVRLDGGGRLPADVVLAATGMLCRDDLARAAGLEVAAGGGVVVEADQRTSVPRVLAVGDGTRRRTATGVPAPSAGHWDAARSDGEAAAAALLGAPAPSRGAPWFWSDRYGRHVEVVGDVGAGSTTVARGRPGPGPFAVLGWRDGVVTGAVSVDDPLTARAARRLVDRATVVDPEQLAGADLRRLARG